MLSLIGLTLGGLGVLGIFTGVVLQKWQVALGGLLAAFVGYWLR